MASLIDYGGRILALGLLAFFLVQVIFSANKLKEEKIAVSTTTRYDKSRLMPSIAVCFHYKKIPLVSTNGSRIVVEATLKDAR